MEEEKRSIEIKHTVKDLSIAIGSTIEEIIKALDFLQDKNRSCKPNRIVENCHFINCTFILPSEFTIEEKLRYFIFSKCKLTDCEFVLNHKNDYCFAFIFVNSLIERNIFKRSPYINTNPKIVIQLKDSIIDGLEVSDLETAMIYERYLDYTFGPFSFPIDNRKSLKHIVMKNVKVNRGSIKFKFILFSVYFNLVINGKIAELDLPEIDREYIDLDKYLENVDFSNTKIKFISGELSGTIFSGPTIKKSDMLIKAIKFNEEDYPISCPETGSFIAYKAYAANIFDSNKDLIKKEYIVVKLRIPKDAKCSSAFGTKCRASKAVIEDLYHIDNLNKKYSSEEINNMRLCSPMFAADGYINQLGQLIGTVVEEKDFDNSRWNECSKGIHFFMTKKECRDFLIYNDILSKPVKEPIKSKPSANCCM